ncbi:hypothetical protein [Paenibacillus sp. 2TAB19]|uniref:hypothetical protein n=1 Tax=Paenibacillus sp. 2TAB19 TaxID=3233003 RepID=UPI003F9D6B39
MIVGTVASARDLPNAIVLAKSVKEHMPGTKIVVGIVESTLPAHVSQCPYFDEVILMNNVLHYPNLSKFWFQYDEQEAKNASKAPLMSYIYDRYVQEHLLVYLDSNTRIYSPLSELIEIPKQHPIVIAGHHTNSDFMEWDWQMEAGKAGIYSSGMVALTRHSEAKRFLAWWSKISERYAGNEYSYLDLAPIYFDNVHTLRHNGYGIEHRNLVERWNIEQIAKDAYTVNGKPLRFIHFSPELAAAARWLDDNKAWKYSQIYQSYALEVAEAANGLGTAMSWSFGSFASGEIIDKEAKQAFRSNYYDNPVIDNPFQLNNGFFQPGASYYRSSSNVDLRPSRKPLRKKNRLKEGSRRAVPSYKRRTSKPLLKTRY